MLKGPAAQQGRIANRTAGVFQDEKAPIDIMVTRQDGTTYVLAVSMRDVPAKASFEIKGIPEKVQAELIGGDRKIEVSGGKFGDDFQGYEVKLFKIR